MPARRALAIRLPPYAVAAIFFLIYSIVSVSRHRRIESTGFDLGIFEQAIRSYAHLRAPVVELKGPGYHLLGDHFHPIIAVLAPAYRLFPTPVTLLVAQAALLAFSAVPVTRLAIRNTGPLIGVGLGLAYGLSWGLQNAVGFDFHEICFAVPLLALSLERLAMRQWAAAASWALPLVLVKEDLPATVAAIGIYIIIAGHRRLLGAAIASLATAVGILILVVLIPAFNPAHVYPYASAAGTVPVWTGWDTKAKTALLLLAPTAFVALRSPLLLFTLPTLAWRFTSANPTYWGTEAHYNAVLMPIVFIAFADSLPRLHTLVHSFRRPHVVAAVAVVVALVVGLALVPGLPLRELASTTTWRGNPVATQARTVLAQIPDGATVAASNHLAPQLTARCVVYLFPAYPNLSLRPNWIAMTDAPDLSLLPQDTAERTAHLVGLGYRVVVHRSGVILLRRTY